MYYYHYYYVIINLTATLYCPKVYLIVYRMQKHCIHRGCHCCFIWFRGLCDVRARNWEYIDLVRVHGWEVTGLTAVPVHFHGYKVGKTRVTGCLERTICCCIQVLCCRKEQESWRTPSLFLPVYWEYFIRAKMIFSVPFIGNHIKIDRTMYIVSLLTVLEFQSNTGYFTVY